MGSVTGFSEAEERALDYAYALVRAGYQVEAAVSYEGKAFLLSNKPIPEEIMLGLLLAETLGIEPRNT